MVATTRGKLRFSTEKKWLILKLFHLLQLIFSSAGNSTRPRPKQEEKYVENLLDFVKASFASPGHDVGILTRGHQWECQFCHVDSPVSCPVLRPQKRVYCLFNHPNELRPLFGSLQLPLCFPKLEHSTEAVKVGCCLERAMALCESSLYGWDVQ